VRVFAKHYVRQRQSNLTTFFNFNEREIIRPTLSNSMDYEKQFRSQNSHSSGSQRLLCTLCPGKSFKDNNRFQIHVDKYHIDINFFYLSTDSITTLLINLKHQLPTIRRLPKACRHLAVDKLSSIINNCLDQINLFL
jgi:hypothetical protein